MQKKLGVIKMYKLRIYKLSGSDKGNLDHEEMFDTKEQMDKRYDECKINKNKQLLESILKFV